MRTLAKLTGSALLIAAGVFLVASILGAVAVCIVPIIVGAVLAEWGSH